MSRALSLEAEDALYRVRGFVLLLELAVEDALSSAGSDKASPDPEWMVLRLTQEQRVALEFATNETVVASDKMVQAWEAGE